MEIFTYEQNVNFLMISYLLKVFIDRTVTKLKRFFMKRPFIK